MSIKRELKLKEWKEAIKEFDRIVSLIEDILKKRVDPFTVDISELLEKMRLLLEKYGDEVLLVDIEALCKIVDLIKEQEEWLQNESLVLSLGPFFALARIKQMSVEEIAEKFCASWTPIAYRDQASISTLMKALNYLDALKKFPKTVDFSLSSEYELDRSSLNLEFLSDEDFREKLETLEKKIKEVLEEKEEVDYWDLVIDRSFERSLENMIILSHLCSRGVISIKINPLSGEIKIMKPRRKSENYSVALVFNYETWVKKIAEKKKTREKS